MFTSVQTNRAKGKVPPLFQNISSRSRGESTHSESHCMFLVTHPLEWAGDCHGPETWASPVQVKSCRCEVKVIHFYWRRLLLCCPPESSLAWGWGCCTAAGWDLSCHWASFQKKLRAMNRTTSSGEGREKTHRGERGGGRVPSVIFFYTVKSKQDNTELFLYVLTLQPHLQG